MSISPESGSRPFAYCRRCKQNRQFERLSLSGKKAREVYRCTECGDEVGEPAQVRNPEYYAGRDMFKGSALDEAADS